MTEELHYTVTFLELRAPVSAAPAPPAGFAIRHVKQPTLEQFRELYDGVGAQYHWTDLHESPPGELRAIVEHPDVELHLIETTEGETAGFFQLDFRQQHDGVVELLFFGLLPGFVGRGLGPWALSESIRCAWRDGVQRLDVNTCTLDHPAALSVYERAGFVPVRRKQHTRTVGSAGWRRE